MPSEIAISFRDVSKQYRLGLVGTSTLRGDITRWWHRIRGLDDPTLTVGTENTLDGTNEEYVWALRDINLEVTKGEVLGLIGKNGAGKSTLLKLLSRVTGPTTGQIDIRGRIASLLEVGTGFHPELTGRDNIFLNGAILGMSKQEIRSKLDEIIEFAGVAKYLDTPVKRYSSGMYVRLAFAVAAHLEPEILVVDEVLAVGDAEFRRKATGKIRNVSEEGGRTVLFVSHNMDAVRNICDRCVNLSCGKIAFQGATDEAIQHYLGNGAEGEKLETNEVVEENGYSVTSARLLPSESHRLTNGESLAVEVEFSVPDERPVSFILNVKREQQLAFAAATFHKTGSVEPGRYRIAFQIPPHLLNPGAHAFDFSIVDDTGNQHQYLYASDLLSCELLDDGFRRGGKYNKRWGGGVSPILNSEIERVTESP